MVAMITNDDAHGSDWSVGTSARETDRTDAVLSVILIQLSAGAIAWLRWQQQEPKKRTAIG